MTKILKLSFILYIVKFTEELNNIMVEKVLFLNK